MINPESANSIPHQLRALLLKEIQEGVYHPGHRIPSERELAKRYRISRTAVRETTAQLLAEGVLVRTHARGTFVAEKPPVSEPPTRNRQIGFWISNGVFNFVQAGYTQILTGVGEVCRTRGYGLQFHCVNGVAEGSDSPFPDRSGSGEFQGGIVVGWVSPYFLERLQQGGFPLVSVDRLAIRDEPEVVRIDYATGTRFAIEHLVQLGHREIGFIGFPTSHKYEAFWRCLEAFGLAYQPRFVQFLQISDLVPSILAGFNCAQKLIVERRLPSAILVTNDYVALGAMEAFAIAGIAVPNQMSIVGYDDIGQTQTPLTTVRVDLIEVGRIATRALLDWIEKGAKPQEQIVVPVELVVRGTTAPPVSCLVGSGCHDPLRAEVAASTPEPGGA